MLSIRDERVRTLAERVMQKTGAPSITAAIRLALENELKELEQKRPLRERVEEMRRRVLGDKVIAADRMAPDSRDDLWDR